MNMYIEPEFKAVISKTEDVLTASPILEGGNMNTGPVEGSEDDLFTISG